MKYFLALIFCACCLFSCTKTFYIVRHAEKAAATGSMNSNNPPLTPEGEERARVLRDSLLPRNIEAIYSTNTIRTMSTARPLSEALNLEVRLYRTDSITILAKKLIKRKRNTLWVGHSNTVDDIVAALMKGTRYFDDLPDAAFDRLFRVRITYLLWGRSHQFKTLRYGKPTP
jgi:phosphohistidine phosphatase SixA